MNLRFGHNLAFNVNYFLSKRFILSTYANYGKSRYYDEINSNTPDWNLQKDSTNADLYDINVGLLIGYKLPLTNWMNISGYIGIGSFTHRREYWWDTGQSNPGIKERTLTDIAFPVRVCLGFIPYKHLELAFIGGFYFEPDFPVVGLYYGPQVSYQF